MGLDARANANAQQDVTGVAGDFAVFWTFMI
jgi:hypothetical protein